MQIMHSNAELQAWRNAVSAKEEVVLVPTMGALHRGHRSLLEFASGLGSTLLVSIFINPLQFEREADLLAYPETMEADLAMLQELGVAAVYRPNAAAMYPQGFQVRVAAGPSALCFEGAARPGHFDGMLTVVHKLLQRCRPHHAVFGQKDAQQLFLVRRMVQDFDLPLQIHAGATWRADDGLAFSSRNVHLDASARQHALVLYRALNAAKAAFEGGCSDPRALEQIMRACFDTSPAQLAYADVVSDTDFESAQSGVPGIWRAVIAARLDGVHLLDNLELGEAPSI